METALIVVESILALVIIVSILMQPAKTDGLSGFIQGKSETFFAKNKSKTKEAMLAKVTIVSMVLFVANTIVINFMK